MEPSETVHVYNCIAATQTTATTAPSTARRNSSLIGETEPPVLAGAAAAFVTRFAGDGVLVLASNLTRGAALRAERRGVAFAAGFFDDDFFADDLRGAGDFERGAGDFDLRPDDFGVDDLRAEERPRVGVFFELDFGIGAMRIAFSIADSPRFDFFADLPPRCETLRLLPAIVVKNSRRFILSKFETFYSVADKCELGCNVHPRLAPAEVLLTRLLYRGGTSRK